MASECVVIRIFAELIVDNLSGVILEFARSRGFFASNRHVADAIGGK